MNCKGTHSAIHVKKGFVDFYKNVASKQIKKQMLLQKKQNIFYLSLKFKQAAGTPQQRF